MGAFAAQVLRKVFAAIFGKGDRGPAEKLLQVPGLLKLAQMLGSVSEACEVIEAGPSITG